MSQQTRGMITLDFLFALVLCLGLSAVLFAWTITLTVIEVTQYITFAAARTYMAAHISEEFQRESAQAKYRELVNHPILGTFYKMSWYQIPTTLDEEEIGNFKHIYGENPLYSEGAAFDGVRIPFEAKALSFNIPLLGDTSEEENFFKTHVASFLTREPTLTECQTFMGSDTRLQEIKKLDARFSAAPIKDDLYVPLLDNGC